MNNFKLCITGLVGIVSVSLIAFLALGCGDDDADSTHELVGTWNLEQVIIVFNQVPIDTLTSADTMSGTATFEKNNTFDLELNIMGYGDTLDGTWSTSGDSLTMDPSDTTATLTVQYDVSGTILTITQGMIIEIQGFPVAVITIQTWREAEFIVPKRIVS